VWNLHPRAPLVPSKSVRASCAWLRAGPLNRPSTNGCPRSEPPRQRSNWQIRGFGRQNAITREHASRQVLCGCSTHPSGKREVRPVDELGLESVTSVCLLLLVSPRKKTPRNFGQKFESFVANTASHPRALTRAKVSCQNLGQAWRARARRSRGCASACDMSRAPACCSASAIHRAVLTRGSTIALASPFESPGM
jgi:hypothetical protein